MSITASELQTELGVASMHAPRVLKELMPYGGSSQFWYIAGGVAYPGRVKHVSTTAADNAATQAAAVLVALAAGPA